MVKNTGHMFITGPDVIKTVLHEEVTKEDLGGVRRTQAPRGSLISPPMMKPALRMVREATAYLPSNNAEDAPVVPSGDAPDRLVRRTA